MEKLQPSLSVEDTCIVDIHAVHMSLHTCTHTHAHTCVHQSGLAALDSLFPPPCGYLECSWLPVRMRRHTCPRPLKHQRMRCLKWSGRVQEARLAGTPISFTHFFPCLLQQMVFTTWSQNLQAFCRTNRAGLFRHLGRPHDRIPSIFYRVSTMAGFGSE